MTETSAPGTLPSLDAVEQRVLGSLLEKQVTVPASYPLTANALRTACNQTSSREPVTDHDEPTLERVARALRDRGLVRIVWSDTGRRTLKYHQTLDEVVPLDAEERALLTVLLLRGPQAPGELRSRTERLQAFADRDAVEEALTRMASRPDPLVRRLERRAGERDHRWLHLLGDDASTEAAARVAGAVGAAGADGRSGVTAVGQRDHELPLRDGAAARDERVRHAYTAIAPAYAEALAGELDDLPFERWLLGLVAERAGGLPVVEVGCGPGHVTAHLASLGAPATGVDLSPEMVQQARTLFPAGHYEVGDLRRLLRPTSAPGWGAVLAWYSLIHLASSELPEAMASLTRPLAPGGWLVMAVHSGTGTLHSDEWFGEQVDLDAVLHEPAELAALARSAGLVDAEWYSRGPVTGRGETTERLYLLARRPD
ncbi:hypothetical protein DFJ68_3187 [Terracoccus luteus]|uniref:Methyltransferase domain-containing protein n=1 Tax=Terracoccus luteus TaxID=53356 RepID=A0A495Y219_9MICO|nr:DUF480 domain-containing protein [Terracoccus luteus]RKT79709.1 hypothetical protein DFJ68_3187 [Terracoccus luteus]